MAAGSTYRLALESLIQPGHHFDAGNERQFRRQLEKQFVGITAYIESLLRDPVSVAAHAATHASGGSDPVALAWSQLTSGVPTTVAGYGITDVYTKTAGDARYAPIAVPWSSITGIPSLVNTVAGRSGTVVLTAADIGAGTFPTGTFAFPTRVTVPLLGTTTAVDVVFDRNSVTQLTLGSLLATFAGHVGIGTAASTSVGLRCSPAVSGGGATQWGMNLVVTTDASLTAYGHSILVSTAVSSAITDIRNIYISTPSLGAGSTVTNIYGIYVDDMTGGGTANYAIKTGLGLVSFGDNVVGAGSYKSGTPSGGTAAAWKLGSYKTATVVADLAHYIEVDIGGTLYKLGVVT